MFHQDVLARQSLARHGERQGDGREQPLGHVGHDDPDREHAGMPERQADRIADREEHDAKPGREYGNEPGQEGHLALQRREGRSSCLREVRDLAERGAHPGREHERASFPGDHRRAGEQDIGAGGQVRLVARDCILEHRDRFAGNGGAVHLHPEGFDEAAVGRNGLAFVQADDVAGHELTAR